jgi:hypothetical protein
MGHAMSSQSVTAFISRCFAAASNSRRSPFLWMVVNLISSNSWDCASHLYSSRSRNSHYKRHTFIIEPQLDEVSHIGRISLYSSPMTAVEFSPRFRTTFAQ